MPRGTANWVHSNASAPITESNGVTLGFDLNALPIFANADEMQHCAEEIVALLQGYGIKAEFRQDVDKNSPRPGDQPMPRGSAGWINAEASAPTTESSGVTLGFDPGALPIFANADEMRRCAEAIIALLQGYGIKAEFRQD